MSRFFGDGFQQAWATAARDFGKGVLKLGEAAVTASDAYSRSINEAIAQSNREPESLLLDEMKLDEPR